MLRTFRLHGEAVQLAGEADGKIADVYHFLYFAMAFGADFAHLQGDKITQGFFVFAQGICQVANDLTARTLQGIDRERRHPWFRAKNMDGFLPLGPCFVPRDFLDVSDLRVTCTVDGELRQDARTRDWIVDLPHALAALSRHLTLRTGDLVLMGTPAGVGPLSDGATVVCAVEGIGALATRIRRPRP